MEKILIEIEDKLNKIIIKLKDDFSVLRTGTANINIFNKIYVDYYGDKMPLNQISSIISNDFHNIIIKPYDCNDEIIKNILTAINISNLNLNPILDDNHQIRINIPSLTEETRISIVKEAKKINEEAKITVRNIRHKYFDLLKKNDSLSEDLKKNIQNEIQKKIDKINEKIDQLFNMKKNEIMNI